MRVKVDNELKDICQKIQDMDLDEAQWAEAESIDSFQSDNICGGFDACEMVFCFGKYVDGEEVYAIQLTLEQIPLITSGIMKSIETITIDLD